MSYTGFKLGASALEEARVRSSKSEGPNRFVDSVLTALDGAYKSEDYNVASAKAAIWCVALSVAQLEKALGIDSNRVDHLPKMLESQLEEYAALEYLSDTLVLRARRGLTPSTVEELRESYKEARAGNTPHLETMLEEFVHESVHFYWDCIKDGPFQGAARNYGDDFPGEQARYAAEAYATLVAAFVMDHDRSALMSAERDQKETVEFSNKVNGYRSSNKAYVDGLRAAAALASLSGAEKESRLREMREALLSYGYDKAYVLVTDLLKLPGAQADDEDGQEPDSGIA